MISPSVNRVRRTVPPPRTRKPLVSSTAWRCGTMCVLCGTLLTEAHWSEASVEVMSRPTSTTAR
jgi:hypothetical protein